MVYNPQFGPNATPASVAVSAAGGILSIYDGAQPAGPSAAVTSQRLLAALPLPSFGIPVISGQQTTVTAQAISPVTALLSGTAAWFRVAQPNGTAVFDGAAGTSASDMVLDSLFVAAGVPVTIASLTISGQTSLAVTGTVAVTVPAPGPPASPSVPSGYGGAEPVPAGAIKWCGYLWEPENWGSGPGQPVASNVSVDPATGYLILKISEVNGNLAGAEVDSVRGDQGIAGNPSTWGYGTYRWVIGTDLTTLDPSIVLGLFSYWAYGSPTSSPANQWGKGGPPGCTEIDIEFSNWQASGNKTGIFAQLGFYADTGGSATSGIPATNGQITHTMVPGSQFPVPTGHPVSTWQFAWTPSSIVWSAWYEDITALSAVPVPDETLIMASGHSYTYSETYGGNQFTGTVKPPAAGKHQTIMNLWTNGGNAASLAGTTVILRSFSYTPSS